jgi:transcriptional regulator GlxA family with amidase domain
MCTTAIIVFVLVINDYLNIFSGRFCIAGSVVPAFLSRRIAGFDRSLFSDVIYDIIRAIFAIVVNITILCFDNALASSISAFVDAFKIANQLWTKTQNKTRPLFSWTLASRNGRSIITSSGLTVGVDGQLPPRTDLIFVPAWHFNSTESLVSETKKIAAWCGPWISLQYKRKAWVAAGCSGTVILANCGLLNGKTITTSWWLHEHFKTFFPEVIVKSSQLIMEDERILSAGPVNSHFNLAMKLIEKMAGYQLALLCAKTMLIDINRPAQIAYEILPVQNNHSNEGILLAQQWMQQNIHKPFDMRLAAKAARMSLRTFIRHFKKSVGVTPIGYLQGIRIDLAKRLLESSDLPLVSILERIGYGDSSAFRRLFKQRTSITPTEYRKRFQANINDSTS